MNANLDIISLVLTTLAADDAQTIGELATALSLDRATLHPVLRALVADGIVTTSGRTRGTRYLLVHEVEPVATSSVITAETCQRGARTRRPRATQPAIEVVDLTAQLAATLALATPAAPLSTVRIEPAPLAQLLPSHAALVAAIVLHDPFQTRCRSVAWQLIGHYGDAAGTAVALDILARASEWQAETAANLLEGAS